MAVVSSITLTPSSNVNVTARRHLRSSGASRVAVMMPRLRSSCKPQALYLSPYSQASGRCSPYKRSPHLSNLGLARRWGIFDNVFSSDWLRETTSCVHPVDIKTRQDRYELQSDCPGMGEEDIELSVSPDRVLTIAGSRKTSRNVQPATNASDDGFTAAEDAASAEAATPAPPTDQHGTAAAASAPAATFDVSYSFSRSFLLPEDADVDGVAAALDKGVLTVSIPRKVVEKPKPRRISISAAVVRNPATE